MKDGRDHHGVPLKSLEVSLLSCCLLPSCLLPLSDTSQCSEAFFLFVCFCHLLVHSSFKFLKWILSNTALIKIIQFWFFRRSSKYLETRVKCQWTKSTQRKNPRCHLVEALSLPASSISVAIRETVHRWQGKKESVISLSWELLRREMEFLSEEWNIPKDLTHFSQNYWTNRMEG